jgi:hypothetical protein
MQGLDQDEHTYEGQSDAAASSRSRKRRFLVIAGLCSFLAFALGIATCWTLWEINHSPVVSVDPTYSTGVCSQPAHRREWRSFSNGEKHDYIEAVRCLARTPPKAQDNGTRFDDFPYAHYYFGGEGERLFVVCSRRQSTNERVVHNMASFLPWHRYFIHLYEQALREDCHYQGYLA